MNVTLHILDLTAKGVQCATAVSTGWTFWLPRSGSVTWTGKVEPGERATAAVPSWLVSKHKQLTEIQYQRAFAYQAPPGLNADIANTEGSLPMTDRPADAGKGSIRRNAKKERPSQPDYLGSAEIRGRKFYVSGWVKDGDDGSKWLSLSFRDAEERTDDRPQRRSSRRPADEIPFEMEWR